MLRKKITYIIAALPLFTLVAFATGPVAYAANACKGVETSLIDCKDGGNSNPVINLMLQIIDFLAVGVGIAVVGGIIWGGMLYASSNGDSTKAKQGVTTIVNAVLGLLVFMFTYAMVNYLVPGGLFN